MYHPFKTFGAGHGETYVLHVTLNEKDLISFMEPLKPISFHVSVQVTNPTFELPDYRKLSLVYEYKDDKMAGNYIYHNDESNI